MTDTRFGLTPGEWFAAKTELRTKLIEVARRASTITYEELASGLASVRLGPTAPALAWLLREISETEESRGRGLLTAVVVRKDTGLPGKGFFELARRHGRNATEQMQCWTEETAVVFAAWSHRAVSED